MLKTDFKDEIVKGIRKHQIVDVETGAIIHKGVVIKNISEIEQEGDVYGADEVNKEHELLNQLSNPNLLINEDFGVNQRGMTRYSTSRKYTVDMWLIKSGSTSVDVNTDGTLTLNKLGSEMAILNQYINDIELEHNDYYAISAMVDGAIVGGKVFFTDTKYPSSGLLPAAYDDENIRLTMGYLEGQSVPMAQIQSKKSKSVLKWAKLEHGKVVTPLVPRPYSEKLAMCQWDYQVGETQAPIVYEYNGNVYLCSMSFPEMRIVPSSKISYAFYDQSGNYISGVTNDRTIFSDSRIMFTTKQSNSPIHNRGNAVMVSYELDAGIY